MRVQVISFGVLKDWLGSPAGTVELPDGATVAALMERLRTTLPAGAPEQMLRGIAVSVNAEYAQAGRVLHDGDEVGLLPPVSGGAPRASAARAGAARTGAARTANPLDETGGEASVVVALTREPIHAAAIVLQPSRMKTARWWSLTESCATIRVGAELSIWTTRLMKRWRSGRCGRWARRRASASACAR